MRFKPMAEIAGKIENDAKNDNLENMETLLLELTNEWGFVNKILIQKTE